MKTITIDFDNVLASTSQHFLDYFETHTWRKIPFESITNWYLTRNTNFDMTQDEIQALFQQFMIDSHTWNTLPIMPGAKQVVADLHDQWHNLLVLSWRRKKYLDLTQQWIATNFGDVFSDVIFTEDLTDHSRTKWEVCLEVWSEMHLDDYTKYALTTADAWVKTLLFDMPWNKTYANDNQHIIRVKGWQDVHTHV